MWIDKENFTQKKVEQEMMMEIPIDQMTMTADQKMATTYTGPYDKKITLPEEVKNSAKYIEIPLEKWGFLIGEIQFHKLFL